MRVHRLAPIAWALLAACSGDYPIDPTPCDDFCLAVQRANCAEDWPEECVSTCEATEGPSRRPECGRTFDRYVACLSEASREDFSCIGGRSVPDPGLCTRTRNEWAECADASGCHERCRELVGRCPTTDFAECIDGCFAARWSCPAEIDGHLRCLSSPGGDCVASSAACESTRLALDECMLGAAGRAP